MVASKSTPEPGGLNYAGKQALCLFASLTSRCGSVNSPSPRRARSPRSSRRRSGSPVPAPQSSKADHQRRAARRGVGRDRGLRELADAQHRVTAAPAGRRPPPAAFYRDCGYGRVPVRLSVEVVEDAHGGPAADRLKSPGNRRRTKRRPRPPLRLRRRSGRVGYAHEDGQPPRSSLPWVFSLQQSGTCIDRCLHRASLPIPRSPTMAARRFSRGRTGAGSASVSSLRIPSPRSRFPGRDRPDSGCGAGALPPLSERYFAGWVKSADICRAEGNILDTMECTHPGRLSSPHGSGLERCLFPRWQLNRLLDTGRQHLAGSQRWDRISQTCPGRRQGLLPCLVH